MDEVLYYYIHDTHILALFCVDIYVLLSSISCSLHFRLLQFTSFPCLYWLECSSWTKQPHCMLFSDDEYSYINGSGCRAQPIESLIYILFFPVSHKHWRMNQLVSHDFQYQNHLECDHQSLLLCRTYHGNSIRLTNMS